MISQKWSIIHKFGYLSGSYVVLLCIIQSSNSFIHVIFGLLNVKLDVIKHLSLSMNQQRHIQKHLMYQLNTLINSIYSISE